METVVVVQNEFTEAFNKANYITTLRQNKKFHYAKVLLNKKD